MNEIASIGNDTIWFQIWNDIKRGGTELLIFIFVFYLLFMRNEVKGFIVGIGKWIIKRIGCKHKSEFIDRQYTFGELKKHHIFKNLDFWLNTGIKSVKFTKLNFTNREYLESHRPIETPEYMLAKEEIAKDILTIKMKCINEALKTLFDEYDYAKLDEDNAKYYLIDSLTKCNIKQQTMYQEMEIPDVFLIKFLALDRIAVSLIMNVVENYFDVNHSLTPISRTYLSLNAVDHYLTVVFNNIATTVTNINGDLDGAKYKGRLINKHSQKKILLPPHSSYGLIVNNKLEELRNKLQADRVYVFKFYPFGEFKSSSSYHSCVYEVVDKGITQELENLQAISNTHYSEIISFLKKKVTIINDISKFNSFIGEDLSKRGINGIIIAPIFNGNNVLMGALVLDYITIEKFEKIVNNKEIDVILNKETSELFPYIDYEDEEMNIGK